MKILILTNSVGGLYNFRCELIEELRKNNEVWISSPEGTHIDDFQSMGCTFIYTDISRHGINPFGDLKLLRFYIKLIKSISPDVVLTYTVKPNIYGGLACRIKKVPFLVNITGLGGALENPGILQKIVLFLYRISIKYAKHVFFQNDSNMNFLKNNKVISDSYSLLPGSGVNLDKFSLMEYPDTEDVMRFLFVGRIMKDKGIEELLKAIRIICEKYSNVCFEFVGGIIDDYKEIIDQFSKEKLILYHGRQIDVKPFLEKSHCVILPSYHEGMSNVLLEAASSGRPVITTNVPGCKETLDNGISGLLCPPRDVESLVEAIEHFISLPHEDKKKMGIMGRKKMELEFDRNLIVEAYLNELKVINTKKYNN